MAVTQRPSAAVLLLLVGGSPALASFHLMQIQQVIGGVGGDPRAQAIQLRMRQPQQELVQQSRLRVHDAAGNNPVLIIQFPGAVANADAGQTILIATEQFRAYTTPGARPDFIMTNPIPASYLPAGSLTFESSIDGVVLARFSWGGAAYTGSNSGSQVNDFDGNFAPPFPGPLPSDSLSALLINRVASAMTTNNAADYGLTAAAAVFTNNSSEQFTVKDDCPQDSSKGESGACGCGVADSDGDSDGRPDCTDPCPENPADLPTGQCSTPAQPEPEPAEMELQAESAPPRTGFCGPATFQSVCLVALTLSLVSYLRPKRR